jgi:hypothetical protein
MKIFMWLGVALILAAVGLGHALANPVAEPDCVWITFEDESLAYRMNPDKPAYDPLADCLP